MKVSLGSKMCLYPSLTVLVGALLNDRPNYITIAHVGILDFSTISLGINRSHFTNAGIQAHGTFSINIPSETMVMETDYCGMVSGRNVDKSALFEHFYGKLNTAPMIRGCPLNMECRLVQTVSMPRHDVFIGEVVETYCDEACITGGAIDYTKLQPILFTMADRSYWRLGERLAAAWSIGKEFRPKG